MNYSENKSLFIILFFLVVAVIVIIIILIIQAFSAPNLHGGEGPNDLFEYVSWHLIPKSTELPTGPAGYALPFPINHPSASNPAIWWPGRDGDISEWKPIAYSGHSLLENFSSDAHTFCAPSSGLYNISFSLLLLHVIDVSNFNPAELVNLTELRLNFGSFIVEYTGKLHRMTSAAKTGYVENRTGGKISNILFERPFQEHLSISDQRFLPYVPFILSVNFDQKVFLDCGDCLQFHIMGPKLLDFIPPPLRVSYYGYFNPKVSPIETSTLTIAKIAN